MSYYQDLMRQEDLIRRAAWLAFETRKQTAVYLLANGELVAEEYDPRRAGQALEVFTPGWERPPKREDAGDPVISACFPVQEEKTPDADRKPKRPAKNGWGIPTF